MRDHGSRLGSEPIGRLLVRMSAPAMVGMIVQACYNLTDAIFVGQWVGPMGIGGIVISYPIQILVMAFAQVIGIGGASIVSRSLGEGKMERAHRTLGNLYTLTLAASLAIALLGSLFTTPLLRFFGATETLLPYALDYARIIVVGAPLFTFAMATNAVIRAEGNARVAMWTMIISGVLNIGLDALFIAVLKLGIRGAAFATVLAQGVSVVYLLYYFLGGRSSLKAKLSDLWPDRQIVAEMFKVGAGSGLRSAASSITMIILNNGLAHYGGDLAISAFGIVNRLLMFFFLPMFGVVQGMMPIVGFNYGARQLDRARHAVRLSNIATTCFSIAVTIVLAVFPAFWLRLFSSDPALIQMGIRVMPIVVIAFPTVGFQVVAAAMYQALGHAVPALILALLRQVILLVPLFLILPRFMGLLGVWVSFPIADAAAAVVTGLMLIRGMRELRDPVSRLHGSSSA